MPEGSGPSTASPRTAPPVTVLVMRQDEAEADGALRPGLAGSEAAADAEDEGGTTTPTCWTHRTRRAAARVRPARRSWRTRTRRVAAQRAGEAPRPARTRAAARPPARWPSSASPGCARSTATRCTRTSTRRRRATRHWALAARPRPAQATSNWRKAQTTYSPLSNREQDPLVIALQDLLF